MKKEVLMLSLGLILLVSLNFVSAANWNESFTNGLIAYYSFDEGSGSIVHNNVQNKWNLETFNNPSWTTGISGESINLVSAFYQNVQSTSADFNLKENFAFNFWVYYGKNGVNIFMYRDSSPCGLEIEGYPAYFKLFVGNCAGNYFETVTTSLGTDWKMLTIVGDGTKTKLYRDGIYIGSTSKTPSISGVKDLVIGKDRSGPSGFIDGKFDELGVWNRSLTDSEVSSLYNQGVGLFYIKNETNPANVTNTTLESWIQEIQDWRILIDNTIKSMAASITNLVSKTDNQEIRISNLENKPVQNNTSGFTNYFKYLSSTDRKAMVCGYGQDNNLTHISDLDWNCDIAYKTTRGKTTSTCKCKEIK